MKLKAWKINHHIYLLKKDVEYAICENGIVESKWTDDIDELFEDTSDIDAMLNNPYIQAEIVICDDPLGYGHELILGLE